MNNTATLPRKYVKKIQLPSATLNIYCLNHCRHLKRVNKQDSGTLMVVNTVRMVITWQAIHPHGHKTNLRDPRNVFVWFGSFKKGHPAGCLCLSPQWWVSCASSVLDPLFSFCLTHDKRYVLSKGRQACFVWLSKMSNNNPSNNGKTSEKPDLQLGFWEINK